MSAFDENLQRAREHEADIEALLDVAKRDAGSGKFGAQLEAERLQALLDATHDPEAEQRLYDQLVEEHRIDEDGELVEDVVPEDEEPEPDPVPEGTVDEVLAWVHGGEQGEEPTEGWRERAERALEAEGDGDDARKTLVEPLTRALEEPADGPGEGAEGSTGPAGAPQA